MRVDDYQFYGQLCLIFGIILLVIGIALPAFTTTYYTTWLGTLHFDSPYLGHGIALVVIGVILIVVSQILYREYRLRMAERRLPQPLPPPPF